MHGKETGTERKSRKSITSRPSVRTTRIGVSDQRKVECWMPSCTGFVREYWINEAQAMLLYHLTPRRGTVIRVILMIPLSSLFGSLPSGDSAWPSLVPCPILTPLENSPCSALLLLRQDPSPSASSQYNRARFCIRQHQHPPD